MERVFEAENGNQVVAINDIQADSFINAGLKEVKDPKKK